MDPRRTDLTSDQTQKIHQSFLTAFQQLARESLPTICAELPFVPERTLTGLLVALGSAATILIQSHMQDLAPAHHTLVVRCSKGSDVSLVVEDPASGSVSGLTVWLIWCEVLFSAPNAPTLRPSTAALIREHALSPLYRNDEERLTGFYTALGDVFNEAPYSDLLRRLAHLPVLLLEVAAENPTSDPFMVEREAQRRLARLYGQKEEISVHHASESALRA